MRNLLALDTETTGLDFAHGTQPFFVSVCDQDQMQRCWEWDVDPYTRMPIIPREDRMEIQEIIDKEELLLLHNPTFDFQALDTVRIHLRDWSKVEDTLLASHLLASNQPHSLTALALLHLTINLKPYEDALEKAVKKARIIARRDYPKWRIAKKDDPMLPSSAGKLWKFDTWLPRAIAEAEGYEEGDEFYSWHTVLREYGNSDTAILPPLYSVIHDKLEKKGLLEIHQARLQILPILYDMETTGITGNVDRLHQKIREYRKKSKICDRTCAKIASKYVEPFPMPKGISNALKHFVFSSEGLGMKPVVTSKKTGDPSLNKAAMNVYFASIETMPKTVMRDPSKSEDAHKFFTSLSEKRKADTAVSYMKAYNRFMVENGDSVFTLFPSLNPTGTSTLRWSSQNPNEQNISKKDGFNLRYVYGPAPGREWWSLDAMNIELRLPAYEAGEEEMIQLFERPNDPPFFGSNHLLVFSILHPDKWDHDDPEGLLKAKKKFASTWYQWTKNGNFAVQYGAMEESGTADRAYGVPGAQRKIQARFKNIAKLNQSLIAQAERTGYVETIPDKTVNPNRGYPLYCKRTNYGRILPTTPLNYHIQGTAMWWMQKAMIRCFDYLQRLGPNYRMIMQVHDELVFDFPYKPNRGNLPKINKIAHLMSLGGDDIGIPTPVSKEYHPDNWSLSA